MRIPPAYANTDREGQYLLGLKFGKAIMDDQIKYGHTIFDAHTHQYALAISSPFGHNTLMFGPTLERQTSPEQRARWMPLVKAGKMIGSYVQTELGHGTFLRGLETTATFDEQTDELVINSPTITSTKYWPSALAFSATHAVVVARLIVGVKDHGPHLFLVQIRSLKTHKCLPGKPSVVQSSCPVLADSGIATRFRSRDGGYRVQDGLQHHRYGIRHLPSRSYPAGPDAHGPRQALPRRHVQQTGP